MFPAREISKQSSIAAALQEKTFTSHNLTGFLTFSVNYFCPEDAWCKNNCNPLVNIGHQFCKLLCTLLSHKARPISQIYCRLMWCRWVTTYGIAIYCRCPAEELALFRPVDGSVTWLWMTGLQHYRGIRSITRKCRKVFPCSQFDRWDLPGWMTINHNDHYTQTPRGQLSPHRSYPCWGCVGSPSPAISLSPLLLLLIQCHEKGERKGSILNTRFPGLPAFLQCFPEQFQAR